MHEAKLGRSGARDSKVDKEPSSGPGRLKKVALEMFGNPPHLPLPPEFRMCLLQCSCFHLSTCIGETYVYNVRVYGVICGRQRGDLRKLRTPPSHLGRIIQSTSRDAPSGRPKSSNPSSNFCQPLLDRSKKKLSRAFAFLYLLHLWKLQYIPP